MFHENFCILEIDYLIDQCSKIMGDKVWIRLKQLVLKFQMRLHCLTALTYITFNLFQQQNVTSGSRRCRSFRKFRSKIRNVRHQTSTFKMADPAGTKTVEEAKKKGKTPPERPNPPPRNENVRDVITQKA